MLRRIAPALLALLALGASACGDATTPAIQVGDLEVSEEEFLDELEEWAGNDAAVESLLRLSPEANLAQGYSTELAGQVAFVDIQLLLHEQELAKRDIELTDSDIDDVIPILFGNDEEAEAEADRVLGGFSDSYRQRVLRVIAAQVAVEEAVGEDFYIQWSQDAIQSTDIEVSSRFGSWDRTTRQVVPPQGPAAAGA